jgi:hypothetical protein
MMEAPGHIFRLSMQCVLLAGCQWQRCGVSHSLPLARSFHACFGLVDHISHSCTPLARAVSCCSISHMM